MEEIKVAINSRIVYAKRLGLFFFVYILGGVGLSGYLGGLLRLPILALIGFICFVVVPIVFRKTFQAKFEKKSSFLFGMNWLSIEIFNATTEKLEREYQLVYENIKSCAISSSSPKTSTITIHLTDAPTFQCSFVHDLAQGTKVDPATSNVAFNIFRRIRGCNANVFLEKPFYASKAGNTALVVLVGLLAVAFVSAAFYKPTLILFSILPTFILSLQIFVRRKCDLDTYTYYENTKDSIV